MGVFYHDTYIVISPSRNVSADINHFRKLKVDIVPQIEATEPTQVANSFRFESENTEMFQAQLERHAVDMKGESNERGTRDFIPHQRHPSKKLKRCKQKQITWKII